MGFPGGSVVKNLPGNAGGVGLIPQLGKSPWRRKRQPTPEFLPGKSHGQRRLAGYSPWGHERIKHDLATKQQQYVIHIPMSEMLGVHLRMEEVRLWW